ncbi:MAG: fluoride efflux transporter CrcB [Bacteroidota bacterium]
MKHVLLVGIGGFIGSVLRYLSYLWIDKRIEGAFPMSTFFVNILGSLILGLIVGLFTRSNVSPELRLFLGVGICGSFTTFSTFAMENVNLLEQKDFVTIVSYASGSLILGTLMALVGYWVGKSF